VARRVAPAHTPDGEGEGGGGGCSSWGAGVGGAAACVWGDSLHNLNNLELEKGWHYVCWRSYCVHSGKVQAIRGGFGAGGGGRGGCGAGGGGRGGFSEPFCGIHSGNGAAGGDGTCGLSWERKLRELEEDVARGVMEVLRLHKGCGAGIYIYIYIYMYIYIYI
jgi:hypothetical protein